MPFQCHSDASLACWALFTINLPSICAEVTDRNYASMKGNYGGECRLDIIQPQPSFVVSGANLTNSLLSSSPPPPPPLSPHFPPSHCRQAQAWLKQIEGLQNAEHYPYLETLETIVAKARPIPVYFDNLSGVNAEQINSQHFLQSISNL